MTRTTKASPERCVVRRPRNAPVARHRRRAAGLWMSASVACLACTPQRSADTVVYASGADLESANPLTTVHPLARQVQRYALLVTLVRFDSTLQPTPYLARAWSWSADRRSVTLALYRGLRWHDGEPTSAADVVFTLNAVRDPATGSPRAADLANIDSVYAINDTAVTLHFRAPPPALPPVLCELPIAPAHVLAGVPRADLRRAGFGFSPVGNGPFKFVRRDAGRRWVFARVRDFPSVLGGPAGIDRLVITVVDEPTTKFAGLVSADLDVAGISPTMAALVERDPSLRLLTYPIALSTAVVFNSSRPPFDDARVRRAIDAIIDRQRIVDAALGGFGSPADGPVPADHPFHLALTRPGPAVADSLLDAAGWRRGGAGRRMRNGSPLSFTLLTVGSGDNAMEQLIQDDLRAHGIVMQIRQVELGAFLGAARERPKRFDALITGIPGDIALSYLVTMFSSRLAGGALDYADYHSSSLDALFDRAQRAPTDDALAAAWRSLQQELAAEVPVSWVYHARGVQGVSRRLDGVHMDLRGEMVTLSQWRVRDARVRDTR